MLKVHEYACFFKILVRQCSQAGIYVEQVELFLKYCLSVRWTSVYNQCLNAIVLRHLRFRCSGVFRWCYVGVPLLRHYSGVFRCSASVLCSVVLCSGIPGFIVRHHGRLEEADSYNLGRNIFRLFDVWSNFLVITSETNLD